MDTELREYLDAMERRLTAGNQALRDEMRQEVAGLHEVIQQVDAAIRNEMRQEVVGLHEGVVVAYEALHKETQREISTLRGETREIGMEVRALRADVAAEVCALRADMKQMEQRLIENIQGRREDIDAAFVDIDSLKRAAQSYSGQIQDHERRITVLEGGSTQIF